MKGSTSGVLSAKVNRREERRGAPDSYDLSELTEEWCMDRIGHQSHHRVRCLFQQFRDIVMVRSPQGTVSKVWQFLKVATTFPIQSSLEPCVLDEYFPL
eukprot:gene11117-7743_t